MGQFYNMGGFWQAKKLSFTTQPSTSAPISTPLATQPTVALQTTGGSTISSATNSVTLQAYSDAACTSAAGGTLTVTTNPQPATSGVATFSGVKYDTASTIYLKASTSNFISACSNSIAIGSASAALWMWLGGSNVASQKGTYGSKGVGSATTIPGSRYQGCNWLDSSGNLWLFGGKGDDTTGIATYLSDLWEYNTGTNKWVWVSGSNAAGQAGKYGSKGVGSVTNIPGSRQGAASWIDASGNLWLFGGIGYDTTGVGGELPDLWEYTPSSSKWTWFSGSCTGNVAGKYGSMGVGSTSNYPGGRDSAVSFIDSSGNLWLFGGEGYDSGGFNNNLNDLWKYMPGTGAWTWMGGSNSVIQGGVYGSKSVANAANVPGARSFAVSWLDASGNFWVFGGNGEDSAAAGGELNDLWEYNPTSNQWTWMSGSNVAGQKGTYGVQGTGSVSNIPGGRDSAVSWIDSSGNFWLFGGHAIDGAGSTGLVNDLWEFTPGTGTWTWVAGSNAISQKGTYGTKGVANSASNPGARQIPNAWYDTTGVLRMFGGKGFDSAGTNNYLNDFWQYH